MIVETVVVGALQVNCYVLGCDRTGSAVVIDPGDNAPAILGVLRKRELKLERILATHAHFDHILGVRPLQELTGAPFWLHPGDRPYVESIRQTAMSWLGVDPGVPPCVDGDLEPGEVVTFGDETLEIRHTPGHSPGGVTFVDQRGGRCFVGDAIFAGSVGRTDLPGGSARTLIDGIHREILSLPDHFVLLSGHGPATSVGQERRTNPFLDPTQFDAWF